MAEARFKKFEVLLEQLELDCKYIFYITKNNGNKTEFTGIYQGESSMYNYIKISNIELSNIEPIYDTNNNNECNLYIYNIDNIKHCSGYILK